MGQFEIVEFLKDKTDYLTAQEISEGIGINVGSVREAISRIIRWSEKIGDPVFDIIQVPKIYTSPKNNVVKCCVYAYKLLKK